MVSRNLNNRILKILYPSIVDGKSKTKNINIKNIKLTVSDENIYSSASEIGTLINAPSVDVELNENFLLSQE